MFTNTKLLQRVQKTTRMVISVFQYIKSIFVKWRIYQVYIAPIIEWYLPTIAHKRRNKTTNILESFQHRMLTMVVGAMGNVSRVELAKTVGEMPVMLKLARLGGRMCDYTKRSIADLLTKRRSPGNPRDKWVGADIFDLGDNFAVLGETWKQSKDKEKYSKKNKDRIVFDVRKVTEWVKNRNRVIARKIRQGLNS